jgi:hypothetical protein
MNDFIILCIKDGTQKKYRTPGNKWNPSVEPFASHRFTLLGELDATYGNGEKKTWEGEIIADNSPDTGFGTPSDLLATLTSKSELFLQDHLGDQYYVRAFGKFTPRYLHNVWDAPSNKAFIPVILVKSGDVA